MFTGIIKALGQVATLTTRAGAARIAIGCDRAGDFGLAPGDSIAVNGVCLTALEPGAGGFAADVSPETLERTTLGRLVPGAAVNLEPALRAGDPLGGHLVSGHIDGLAECVESESLGDNRRMTFAAPGPLARYIVHKGSVTLDGVSLTVNRVDGPRFELNLIPHTLAATTLGRLRPGDPVNLEVDQIARYLERLLEMRS